MKQHRNRPIISFTIDKKIVDKFTTITENMSINKSKLMEKLIKRWVEKNETKNKMEKKLP
jgi:metal-responsive CopG/Arc/MetJ family transcriptional regulator